MTHKEEPAQPAAGGLEAVRRVRHLKRGSVYDVIGEGEVQISTGSGMRMLAEGFKMVVYRAHSDGKLWLRFPDEFNDPSRFEKVTHD